MRNESRYIARCLDSLNKQTYKNFEIILIDDGSTDDTIEIASLYNVSILKQQHAGPGKARNRWAKEAKGDILIFVDADMYFDKDYIKNLTQPILEEKEIGTAHGQELVGNPKNKLAIAWCINRIPHPEKRSGVYRAIKKDIFLESWWFDASKGYFDDNLSKINDGKWALTILDAICYHNNPESIQEIYKHSQRVGKSLIQSWEIKNYLRKYIKWIIVLLTILTVWIILFWEKSGIIIWVATIGIVLLIGIKTIERTIKEKEISHLIYVPLVVLSRWIGYITWMIKYLIYSLVLNIQNKRVSFSSKKN